MKKHKSFLAYPYVLWSALFIVIPLILVFFFSFTVEVDNKMVFSLQNYERLINPICTPISSLSSTANLNNIFASSG